MAEQSQAEAEIWMNLDIELAKFIVVGLRQFCDNSNGYPDNYSSYEDWVSRLNSIANRLEVYTQRFSYDMGTELEILRMGQEAMRELADVFPALWD